MKKRVTIVSLEIIILIGIIGLSYNYNNKNEFTQNGVTYALTLNGESTNTFPSKGMYRADVICSNATGKWLYDEWKLAIEDITSDNVSCDIDFTTISQTNLNDYIISLSGQTQGTGEVVLENGYRYEGKDPNNYIWFNNELWRIIGVFDENSHGVSGQNLVKIIRNESIGGLVWDNDTTETIYGKNDWTTSDLKNLLNGAYLNSENGTGGEYCYGYSTTMGANCDYRESGINNTYRPMIENVTWYLGGYSRTSTSATAEEFYADERGDAVYNGRPTEWIGKIGLMYPSDYGYSVLASSCARTTNLGSYDSAICGAQSWLYGESYEWTITSAANSNTWLYSLHLGKITYGTMSYTRNGLATKPVLYLNSSVYVIDGDGSQSDPYIIGM